jgi:hypothetical protein
MTSPFQDKSVLYLLKGRMSDGQPYYAYLAVEAARLPELKMAERQGSFRLEDYGEVLAGEVGTDQPSDFVLEQVKHIFEGSSDGNVPSKE